MSDADVRELVRSAEKQGDGASWERAALALARLERLDEAGEALARTYALGGEAKEVAKTLEPGSLADFAESRSIAVFESPDMAFAPDGRRLWCVQTISPTGLVGFDPETGKLAGRIPRRLHSGLVAASPCGTKVAILQGDGRFEVLAVADARVLASTDTERGMQLAWIDRETLFVQGLDASRTYRFTGSEIVPGTLVEGNAVFAAGPDLYRVGAAALEGPSGAPSLPLP